MALNQSFNQDNLGNMGVAGAVSTAAPSYTTGTNAALSLTLTGLLRTDGSGVTQPISASSLPLPTGASTSALQSTGNATLLTISGQLPATLGQKLMATSLAITIASDQSAIPITAAALPLPSGASTSALQTSGNASLSSIDTKTPTLGQKVMTGSVPVVIASDQVVPVSFSNSSTATISSVASSISTGVLLAANAARKGATIYNDGLSQLFVACAATASTTAFTYKLQAGAAVNIDFNFVGAISGIWAAALGSARITEFT